MYVYMLIGSCQRTRELILVITLVSVILKQVCSTKYLGVYLDEHLTWKAHVDYVFNRVKQNLFAINKLSFRFYNCCMH